MVVPRVRYTPVVQQRVIGHEFLDDARHQKPQDHVEPQVDQKIPGGPQKCVDRFDHPRSRLQLFDFRLGVFRGVAGDGSLLRWGGVEQFVEKHVERVFVNVLVNDQANLRNAVFLSIALLSPPMARGFPGILGRRMKLSLFLRGHLWRKLAKCWHEVFRRQGYGH